MYTYTYMCLYIIYRFMNLRSYMFTRTEFNYCILPCLSVFNRVSRVPALRNQFALRYKRRSDFLCFCIKIIRDEITRCYVRYFDHQRLIYDFIKKILTSKENLQTFIDCNCVCSLFLSFFHC